MKKNQSFMVVTSDNWLEVWSIGYSSKEKAQLRVDEGYYKICNAGTKRPKIASYYT